MTCCAAFLAADGAYLATDGVGFRGERLERTFGRKAVEDRGVTVLVSGAAAGFAAVADVLDSYAYGPRTPLDVSVFAADVAEALETRFGWPGSFSGDGEPKHWDLNLLVTDGASLFEVDGYLWARRVPSDAFAAVGAVHFACGAAYAARAAGVGPEKLVRLALEAQIHYSPHAAEPIYAWKVEKPRRPLLVGDDRVERSAP